MGCFSSGLEVCGEQRAATTKGKQNPKFEYRNPKQTQNPNHPNPKQAAILVLNFLFG
jgi:hypothetical protein